MSGGGAFGANRVGGIIPAKGEIELNAGRPVTKLKVRNTGDRPVQIGSHFHFFEVNRCLSFSRWEAFGMRLDIPSGTSVRFEPGEQKTVQLVELRGRNRCFGFNGLTMGPAGAMERDTALRCARERGFAGAAEPDQEAKEGDA